MSKNVCQLQRGGQLAAQSISNCCIKPFKLSKDLLYNFIGHFTKHVGIAKRQPNPTLTCVEKGAGEEAGGRRNSRAGCHLHTMNFDTEITDDNARRKDMINKR